MKFNPEDSWDNILEGLEEPKRKRRVLAILPWLLGGLGLFLGIYLFVSNQNQSERIDHLQNQINDIGESSEKNIKTINAQDLKQVSENNKTPKQTGITTNETENKSNIQINHEVKSDHASVETKTTKPSKEKQNVSLEERKATTARKLLPSNNNNNNNNNNTNVEEKEMLSSVVGGSDKIVNTNNVALDFQKIPSLDNLLFHIQDRALTDLSFLKAKSLSKEEAIQFLIGITGRYNNWFDVNTGKIDNVLEELRTENNTLASFSLGLNSSIAINKKWTTSLGVLYNQRSHQTIYLLNLPFSTTNETLDAEGELINEFQHSLPTSLGEVQTGLVLSRSQGSNIADDENVGIDLSFNTVTKSILIPINASYFPRGINNGFYFSGGIINEVILSSELSGIESHSQHDLVNDKSIDIQYNAEQQNNYVLGASVGLGYAWNIKDDFNLMLGANYDFGLNNHYENNGYKHKLNNLSMGVSVVMRS